MLLIKDDRFKLGADNTLELTDIQPQDAGDFVCQISLKAGETLEIAHTVEVLGKKRILSYVNILGGARKVSPLRLALTKKGKKSFCTIKREGIVIFS